MKLLQKTNRVYLIYSTFLLLSSGLILYFILTNLVKNELTEKLSLNIDRIIAQIEDGKPVTSLPPIVEITEINSIENIGLIIKDTSMVDPINGDEELFHQISIAKTIHGKTYQIIARQVILEPHDFYNSIGVSLLIIFTLLLISLTFVLRNISKEIWKPFYSNLGKLKNYSIHDKTKIQLETSQIVEFNALNSTIESLTEKIQSDFKTLKDFTENASHEMQTPVAIIKNKMEMMMQEPHLSDLQRAQIKSTFNAAHRLSKLNKSLLILAQIENNQFHQKSNVHLADELEKLIALYEDFIAEKNITIDKNFQFALTLFENQTLIEILLSNLLFNAIKHNIPSGNISLTINKNNFVISNSGKSLNIASEKLFERFVKNDPASESFGLGLSIVQKICETNLWKIEYSFVEPLHRIEIQF